MRAAASARDARELELPLPDFAPGLAGAELLAEVAAAVLPAVHVPGDAPGVWPRNSDAAVARALARLRGCAAVSPPGASSRAAALDEDALVEVLCAPGALETLALTRPLLPGSLPPRELLAACVDVSAPPRRVRFAPRSRGARTRRPTRRARSARGCARWRRPPGRRCSASTIWEASDDFAHAARVSLGGLLELLPPM